MGSFRQYWTVHDLLGDYRYWRGRYPKYLRERAWASWAYLRIRWNIPNHLTVDGYVQRVVEGHAPRGPVSYIGGRDS